MKRTVAGLLLVGVAACGGGGRPATPEVNVPYCMVEDGTNYCGQNLFMVFRSDGLIEQWTDDGRDSAFEPGFNYNDKGDLFLVGDDTPTAKMKSIENGIRLAPIDTSFEEELSFIRYDGARAERLGYLFEATDGKDFLEKQQIAQDYLR